MTRKEAIKTLKELWRETNDSWYEGVYNMAIEALQAEPKTGKWEWEKKVYKGEDDKDIEYWQLRCSECGARQQIGWQNVNFCPNCGIRIEGVEEEPD